MASKYYPIPIRLANLKSGKNKLVDIKKSVEQNIELIIKTLPTTIKHDPGFGISFKKYKFTKILSENRDEKFLASLKKKIKEQILLDLNKYESRVKNYDLILDDKLNLMIYGKYSDGKEYKEAFSIDL